MCVSIWYIKTFFGRETQTRDKSCMKKVVTKLCIFNRMFVKNLKSDIKTTDISKGYHNTISLLHVLGTEIWLTPSRYNFSVTNRK